MAISRTETARRCHIPLPSATLLSVATALRVGGTNPRLNPMPNPKSRTATQGAIAFAREDLAAFSALT
jgi:hypothetical protein